MSENKGSTSELQRVLTFTDLLLAAIGWIIGAGIMTIMSTGIGITGRSIPLSFGVAMLIVLSLSLPQLFIAGTVRLRGGQYTMIGLLCGKWWSGFFVIVNFFANISFVTLAISFASYFMSLFGFGNEKVIAMVVLTLFYVLNLLGVDKFAKVQNVIVILLLAALGLYAAFGIGKIDPNYFDTSSPEWMMAGIGGVFTTGGLMTFALGGGIGVINLSAQAKNPTRDIPLAVIISTLAVAVVYAVLSVITAGVLPVAQVANQNLAVVAEITRPRLAYVAFIIFGAGFAIVSTINSKFAAACPPILQAADDGWFPKGIAKLSRWKTPYVILTGLYLFGAVCIIGGLSLANASSMAVITSSTCIMIIDLCTFQIAKKCPAEWSKSKFHCKPAMLMFVSLLGAGASLINIILNVSLLSKSVIILNFVFMGAAAVFATIRYKKANMVISYEAA